MGNFTEPASTVSFGKLRRTCQRLNRNKIIVIAGAQTGADRAAHKDFGLTKNQIKDIAKDIPNNTAAGLLLIEHLWARKFREIAMKKHGVVLANSFISPLELVEPGAELAEGAIIAERAHDIY